MSFPLTFCFLDFLLLLLLVMPNAAVSCPPAAVKIRFRRINRMPSKCQAMHKHTTLPRGRRVFLFFFVQGWAVNALPRPSLSTLSLETCFGFSCSLGNPSNHTHTLSLSLLPQTTESHGYGESSRCNQDEWPWFSL
ncbi:uncharacterized protein LY79DRAFT_171836 [Colletotrichum navitas]|uniref:Secreted protein n=1 Tax=Colletotrichum navitas TaxID=681940 RepID=A0AAD8Q240_9PEZI|nr:uncharacterized protein LY79DRAFT_171836 [Colletotrichum navitas]KAK1593832.1 hypothetical protein LY79DRAFT_171836 [Colletotrichum navitas]